MQDDNAIVILITGLPATGKTSLARILSEHTGIPSFSKDFIKEIAFNVLPVESREASQKIGILSEEILLGIATQCLQSCNSVIIESTFRHQFISGWLQYISDKKAPLICILLKADRDVLIKRFADRSSNRSDNHFDIEYISVLRSEKEIIWHGYAVEYIEYDTTILDDSILQSLANDILAILDKYL